MPLNKSKGNMYPWCTHVHTHIGGKCPHKCCYCFAQKYPATLSGKYHGPLRFMTDELNVDYGKERIIFIEHMNDMFAREVEESWIKRILEHCRKYPNNKYVFQTKNPKNAWEYREYFPAEFLIGTTIETNREYTDVSKAPTPYDRATGIAFFQNTFVTIEPILDFDLVPFVDLIKLAHPGFVNIGADSKRGKLPEPEGQKIRFLFQWLKRDAGVEILKKTNLERLLK